jgi:hypothetical protein
LVYTAILLGVFATYLVISLHAGINALPEFRDGWAYDAIAFNIVNHRGFGFAPDDPDWRRPYLEDQAHKEDFQGALRSFRRQLHSDYYSTTYYPPGMPSLLTLVYGIVGRHFAAWRILSCAIMAGAATVAAAISAEFASMSAAIITALLILQCPMLTASSHFFL